MSGFIIAFRYDDDLRNGLSAADFLVLRLIRLYPLFLLGACLGLVPALVAVMSDMRITCMTGSSPRSRSPSLCSRRVGRSPISASSIR